MGSSIILAPNFSGFNGQEFTFTDICQLIRRKEKTDFVSENQVQNQDILRFLWKRTEISF